VGRSYTAGNAAGHAFLYVGTPGVDGHMIDLDAWLDANNPTEGAKWTLFEARGLNDSGLITGVGTYNDGPGGLADGDRAFLLDASSLVVPEPSTLALAAIGGFLLALRARRRSAARFCVAIILLLFAAVVPNSSATAAAVPYAGIDLYTL